MAVLFRKCKLFEKTFAAYKNNAKVVKAFKEFVNFKSEHPTERFGSKDYKFTGILSQYYHSALSFDVSVIYQLKREGADQVIYLYGLFSHDESGTGQPANVNRMKALNSKLDNQEF